MYNGRMSLEEGAWEAANVSSFGTRGSGSLHCEEGYEIENDHEVYHDFH
jgi:hypothetical protein